MEPSKDGIGHDYRPLDSGFYLEVHVGSVEVSGGLHGAIIESSWIPSSETKYSTVLQGIPCVNLRNFDIGSMGKLSNLLHRAI